MPQPVRIPQAVKTRKTPMIRMVPTRACGTTRRGSALSSARGTTPSQPVRAKIEKMTPREKGLGSTTAFAGLNADRLTPPGPGTNNPQAARTVLPITLIRTNSALAGKSKAEMKEGMKAAIEKGELPALEPGAMAYMLSKQGVLNSKCGNCAPHLMFYVPVKDAQTWGAGALSSDLPVLLAPHFNGAPEPVTEFIVPVSAWSDGTSADSGDHAH